MGENGEGQALEEQGSLGPKELAQFIDQNVISDPSQVVTVDYHTRQPQLPAEKVVPSTMEELADMEDASTGEPDWSSDDPTRRVVACFDSVSESGIRQIMTVYKEFTNDAQGQPDGKYVRYVIRQCEQAGDVAQFSIYSWDMKGNQAVNPFVEEGISPGQRRDEFVQRFLDSGGLYSPTGGRAYRKLEASLKIEEVGLNVRDLVAARAFSPSMLEATVGEYSQPGRTVKGPTIIDQGPPSIGPAGNPGGK